MENKRVYITDLVSGILDRHLPIIDNISSLLDADPVRASRIIERLLKRTIRQFCYYLPMPWDLRREITGTSYTFIDNYFLLAKDEIPFSELELIPDAIARVGFGGGGWEVTGNYYEYMRPTLKIGDGDYFIRAICEYPLYTEYDQNGLLTNKSHIFGLSPTVMNQFENMLDWTFLSSIKARSELVKLPLSGAEFLNLDTTLQTLSTAIDDDKTAASTLGLSWL